MKQKGLYPYTLQPIAVNMSDGEFKVAQLALFKKTAQSQPIMPTKKEWLIMAIITALAVLGLILVSGYSTILFWFMLMGVVIYLLLRTLGLKWYMQKEYEKQVAQTAQPEELDGMKLGVQPHGLVLSLPNVKNTQTAKLPKGVALKGIAAQQAVIDWRNISGWDETADFLFVIFTLDGQTGSQIIPKRLQHRGLPIDTIKEHLAKIRPAGLKHSTPPTKKLNKVT